MAFFRCLAQMPARGLKPNQDSFDDVIPTLLIGKFAKEGNIAGSWMFLDEMISHGFRPTPTLYKMLVSGMAKNGFSQEALHAIDRASRDGIVFSGKVYTDILREAAREGQIESIFGLLQKIESSSVSMEISHANSLLHAYRKLGDLVNVRISFQNLIQAKLRPDSHSWNTLVKSEFSFGGDGEEACNQMLSAGVPWDWQTRAWLLKSIAAEEPR